MAAVAAQADTAETVATGKKIIAPVRMAQAVAAVAARAISVTVATVAA